MKINDKQTYDMVKRLICDLIDKEIKAQKYLCDLIDHFGFEEKYYMAIKSRISNAKLHKAIWKKLEFPEIVDAEFKEID